MSPATDFRRVGVQLGDRRVDVALPAASTLTEALQAVQAAEARALGVDPTGVIHTIGPRTALPADALPNLDPARGAVVVDRTGQRLDPHLTVGALTEDGALLAVLSPRPARAGRSGRRTDRGTSPGALPGPVACTAAAVLLAVALLALPAAAPVLDVRWRMPLLAVTLLAGLLAALGPLAWETAVGRATQIRTPAQGGGTKAAGAGAARAGAERAAHAAPSARTGSGAHRAAPPPARAAWDPGRWWEIGAGARTLSCALLGLAAGLLAYPDVSGAGRLSLVAGLFGAAVLLGLRWATARVDAVRQSAGVLAVVLAAAAALCALGLLASLPPSAPAALICGLVPPLLRALPSWSLSVPEDLLVDVRRFTTTVWTVRGGPGLAPSRVNRRAVGATMDRAERRQRTATLLLSLLPALALPFVLADAGRDTWTRWGTFALTACLLLALALDPRTARGRTERILPRIGAGLVALEAALATCLAAPQAAVVGAMAGCLAAGAIAVGVALPIGRGARSVGLSRICDALTALAVVLSLPAALVAMDTVEILRAAKPH